MIKPSQARYVTIPRFAELSGYSESAIRARMKNGTWPLGKVYVKAPDGRLLIDVEGYNEWMDGPCYDVLPATPDQREPDATSDDHNEHGPRRPRRRREITVKEAVAEVLNRKAERIARKRAQGHE